MKRLFAFLIILTLIFSLVGFAQMKCEKRDDAGKVGLVFGFQGLSNLATSPFNGGIGIKYYPINNLAARLSVGGFYQNPVPVNNTDGTSGSEMTSNKHKGAVNISLGILVDLFKSCNTNGYIGGEGFWYHSSQDPVLNTYGVDGVIGGEFEVFKNVSLGAEYKILLSKQNDPNTWSISLANNVTAFLLNIYF